MRPGGAGARAYRYDRSSVSAALDLGLELSALLAGERRRVDLVAQGTGARLFAQGDSELEPGGEGAGALERVVRPFRASATSRTLAAAASLFLKSRSRSAARRALPSRESERDPAAPSSSSSARPAG